MVRWRGLDPRSLALKADVKTDSTGGPTWWIGEAVITPALNAGDRGWSPH